VMRERASFGEKHTRTSNLSTVGAAILTNARGEAREVPGLRGFFGLPSAGGDFRLHFSIPEGSPPLSSLPLAGSTCRRRARPLGRIPVGSRPGVKMMSPPRQRPEVPHLPVVASRPFQMAQGTGRRWMGML
jgi:hypothetical protein